MITTVKEWKQFKLNEKVDNLNQRIAKLEGRRMDSDYPVDNNTPLIELAFKNKLVGEYEYLTEDEEGIASGFSAILVDEDDQFLLDFLLNNKKNIKLINTFLEPLKLKLMSSEPFDGDEDELQMNVVLL
jgi:hypothetical protein